jgi:hypothetical protein
MLSVISLAGSVNALEARGDQIGLRRLIESLFTRIEAWNCRKDGAARWERHVQMHDDPPRIICQTLLRQ